MLGEDFVLVREKSKRSFSFGISERCTSVSTSARIHTHTHARAQFLSPPLSVHSHDAIKFRQSSYRFRGGSCSVFCLHCRSRCWRLIERLGTPYRRVPCHVRLGLRGKKGGLFLGIPISLLHPYLKGGISYNCIKRNHWAHKAHVITAAGSRSRCYTCAAPLSASHAANGMNNGQQLNRDSALPSIHDTYRRLIKLVRRITEGGLVGARYRDNLLISQQAACHSHSVGTE